MSSRISHFLSALLGAGTVAVAVVVLALTGAFDDDDGAERAALPAATSAGTDAAPAARPVAARGMTDVADLYERSRTGVVQVEAERQPSRSLFGGGRGASGSGFILDRRGHIVTNEHVVDEARNVKVRFAKEQQPVDAKVVGTDPSTDLAVLKVDPTKVEGGLDPLPLGSSRDLRVGEPTVALGSPFGLNGTLTTGVVSALGRTIEAPNEFSIEDVVQTDAAINPGNSGGPLLDAAGRVIGINAQIATGTGANSGVGFAIPVDTAKQVVPKLIADGEIVRPWLGVSSGEITEELAERFDLPTADGAVVAEVVPGSPAAKAGLRPRDVIVSVGGKQVEGPEDVADLVTARKPGERVEVEVRRRGAEPKTLTVKLGTRPSDPRK